MSDDIEVQELEDGTLHVTDPNDIVEESDDDDDDDDHVRAVESSAETESSVTDEKDNSPNPKSDRNKRLRDARKGKLRAQQDTYKSKIAAQDAQIAELTAWRQLQENKQSGSEMAQLDNELRKVAESYQYHKRQIADAHGQQDGGVILADATEKMVLASRRYDDLSRVKQQVIQNQNKPQAIDPVLLMHGQKWIENNPWYDPASGDEDSEIALVIDRRMQKDGWNSKTPEYWEELDARLKRKLPHRYKSSYNNPKPRSVVTGSGRETSSGGNAGYTLSREQVQAMRDAGIYDDPVKRADMIRRFRAIDKQGASA